MSEEHILVEGESFETGFYYNLNCIVYYGLYILTRFGDKVFKMQQTWLNWCCNDLSFKYLFMQFCNINSSPSQNSLSIDIHAHSLSIQLIHNKVAFFQMHCLLFFCVFFFFLAGL